MAKRVEIFGPDPKGLLVFDGNGQYSQIIVNPDVPKFKVNNRLKGTPEETGGCARNHRELRQLDDR